MKRIVVIGLLCTISSVKASEITIYPSFSEVREIVRLSGEKFDWTPPADLGQFLQQDSLELSDPNVLSMSLLPPTPSLLEMFEGKEVKVYYDGDYQKALVVNAQKMIFLINGAYIQIQTPSVQYPSLEGWRVSATYSWRFSGEARSSRLQYRTRGVYWNQTKYTLNQDQPNSQANLIAWAEIRNDSLVNYKSDKATLFAGFVPFEISETQQSSNRTPAILASQPTRPFATPTPVPTITNQSEVSGLQKFEYIGAFELTGRSILNLPFTRSQPLVNNVLEYRGVFSPTRQFNSAIQRVYRFQAPINMPKGSITIRENGQLVGRAAIGDNAKGNRLRLDLGKDFDIKLRRTSKLLERRSTRSVEYTKYQISLQIKNTKSRAIKVSLIETGCDGWKLFNPSGKGLVMSNGGLTLETEIAVGQTHTATLFASQTLQKTPRGEVIFVPPSYGC